MPDPSLRRRPKQQRRDYLAATLAWPLLLCCCGCPFTAGTSYDKSNNNSLSTASDLPLSTSQNEVSFTGSISSSGDIDMYNVGTLSPGDRIAIDVQTDSGNLDPVAALFNSGAELIAFNDDRNPDGSNLNPLIDIVLPANAGTYYAGVIGYPGDNTTGRYRMTVRIARNVGVLKPAGQIVFLDWNGGQGIVIPNVGRFNLPPFSAAHVGLPSAQTAALKDRVQQIVKSRYALFDFTLLNSDDDAVPSPAHSTVYFGGSDPQAFAISQEIDTFNANPSDDSIVFTGSFPGAFLTQPTFEEMAQALGNTTAHEVGHLLGLVHTADCNDLMDTTCFNDRILSPQAFDSGTLDASVWPFGAQPEVDILTWVLGLAGS